MERDFVVSGVHIGEHGFDKKTLLDEIQARAIERGLSFVCLRPTLNGDTKREEFVSWARYLAEHEIYFMFLYCTQFPGTGEFIDKETARGIKEAGGKYFLGDAIGETGSKYSANFKNYYLNKIPTKAYRMPKQNLGNTYLAENEYVSAVKYYVDMQKEIGLEYHPSVEASFLHKYNAKAGINIPGAEVMIGNPEILLASTRGTARSFGNRLWSCYIAHEWYGGFRHEDMLKRKRLKMIHDYAYLAGANIIVSESGDYAVTSYGADYDENSFICREYQDVIRSFAEFVRNDKRPKGGPKVKVAFVHGNTDGWSGGTLCSSLWGQHDDADWGNSDAENSWRILEETGSKRGWYDKENYGETDMSAAPAYGLYDIVSAEESLDTLLRYDYLIYAGFNAMTEEIYDRLTEYVRAGGRLIMVAAHLNTSTRRDGDVRLIKDGNVEELFGCSLEGEVLTNDGYKFRESVIPEIKYPCGDVYYSDPLYSNGYARYAKATLRGGSWAAKLDRKMGYSEEEKPIFDEDLPAVIENKLGKGYAILMTALDYPGNNAVYPAYRAVVREVMTASARECDVKIYANDRVRFSVYEGNRIYLLNTDYDCNAEVYVKRGKKTEHYTLLPCEFRALESAEE